MLFIYGLTVLMDSDANFAPLNVADDILHLGLGLGMIALGALLTRRSDLERHTDVANA